jgi:putative addiction module component (TIGR02574 family)
LDRGVQFKEPLFTLKKGVPSDTPNMIVERIPELKALSSEEKLLLVGELWDELAADPKALPARPDHINVLQERLEHYRKHPDDVTAWEAVRARILSSR